MRRLLVVLALVTLSALTLSGCGGGGSAGNGESLPTKTIDITIKGASVTPNGERVAVRPGQRIELDVTADEPGEIHVHSSPEQEFRYDRGSSTIAVKPLDTPGIVAVESHTLGKVILQLQVQ